MDIAKEILRRYKEEKNFIKSTILAELIADNVHSQEGLDKCANFYDDLRYHEEDLYMLLDNIDDIGEYVDSNNVYPNSDFEDQLGCIIQSFLFIVDDCLRHYAQSLADEFREVKEKEDSCH